MLNSHPCVAIPKIHRHKEVPLKIFAKDEFTNAPFTGYITKNNWYYKIKYKQTAVNVRADHLNQKFKNFLSQFEYKNVYENRLKKLIIEEFRKKIANNIEENTQLKKKLSETKNKLEKIEERYVTDEISLEIFDKFSKKYKEDIQKIDENLSKRGFESSNLEKAAVKGLKIAQNISQLWDSADFDNKRKLQLLVFPEGIMYSKQKDRVRTNRINSLFQSIPLLTMAFSENRNGNSKKNCLKYSSVPRTGIEPAHPCGYQILSLARLPIPPSGQMGCNIKILVAIDI